MRIHKTNIVVDYIERLFILKNSIVNIGLDVAFDLWHVFMIFSTHTHIHYCV